MYKYLRELKNIHKGQDIYIVGSGASLNHLDFSFIDNKITIARISEIAINFFGDFFFFSATECFDKLCCFKLSSELKLLSHSSHLYSILIYF